tara:strand:- start:2343 stop:3668 length:1326 start_codon:yes stop_codon:yes gene_type:complete
MLKKSEQKTVYVGMSADILHQGHMNILSIAKDKGYVVVGLLTDEAISSYKNTPLLSYLEREKMLKNIKLVDEIIPQSTLDYVDNLNKIQPNYVVHGDDWKTGTQKETRSRVIHALKKWGGELIEPEYTPGISSTLIKEAIKDNSKIETRGITTTRRLSSLKKLLSEKDIVRALEAHNGLTGLIVEKTKKSDREFNAIWISSLTDSTAKGKPDTELVNFESRFSTIEQILEVTTKPLIVDADTGGLTEHFRYHVRTLERLGVSAVIIEDKKGAKRNSLFGSDVSQMQESTEIFCQKIKAAKEATISKDFMIIARIESLIMDKGVNHAIERAKAYVSSGADGIMIHSKDRDTKDLFIFCEEYSNFTNKVPLVVVPSAYPQITEQELIENGIDIVIYANHLIRSAYPSMTKTAELILENQSAEFASKKYCMSISEIIKLIPEDY